MPSSSHLSFIPNGSHEQLEDFVVLILTEPWYPLTHVHVRVLVLSLLFFRIFSAPSVFVLRASTIRCHRVVQDLLLERAISKATLVRVDQMTQIFLETSSNLDELVIRHLMA